MTQILGQEPVQIPDPILTKWGEIRFDQTSNLEDPDFTPVFFDPDVIDEDTQNKFRVGQFDIHNDYLPKVLEVITALVNLPFEDGLELQKAILKNLNGISIRYCNIPGLEINPEQ